MAQKRMIDKKISVSEQVADLPRDAQLVYTWAIPHADDIGLLPYSKRTLKATIVPMWDISMEDFGRLITEMEIQKLWSIYDYNGQLFYRINNFTRYQTLKKDRQPQTLLPIELKTKPKDSWDMLEDLGFQLEDTDFQLESEVKRSEVKRSEEKGDTPSKQAKSFFEGNIDELLELFSKGNDPKYIKQEFQKFILYWTEPNKSGTKQRWEQQPTFDVKRRLFTWLSRASSFKGNYKQREVVI